APVISLAVEPKTKSDQEKLGTGLAKLMQEDPTFKVETDKDTGQTKISGMGELHLEIIVDRLKREFGVAANVGKPQVAYKETIRRASPVLLEPIMKVEVVTPDDYTGAVTGDLSGRRGHLEGQVSRGGTQIITAMVPLSTMFGYSTDLRSRTQGRATYTMHF